MEGRWKYSIDKERELRIRALLEVQNHLTLEEATNQADLHKQSFKIRKRISQVLIGEVDKVHGVATWMNVLQQQHQAKVECQKTTEPPVIDMGKGKGIVGVETLVKANISTEPVIVDITRDIGGDLTPSTLLVSPVKGKT